MKFTAEVTVPDTMIREANSVDIDRLMRDRLKHELDRKVNAFYGETPYTVRYSPVHMLRREFDYILRQPVEVNEVERTTIRWYEVGSPDPIEIPGLYTRKACPYCGSRSPEDARGNCSACGAPR